MTSNQSKDSQAFLSSTNSRCRASQFAIRSKWAPLQFGNLAIRKFLGSEPRRVSTLLGRARQGTTQDTPSLSVLGMSHRKVTSLGFNLASVTDLNEFKLHTVYAVISELIKPFQLVG